MLKSFSSSLSTITMGGAAKRRKKRKEATRKQKVDEVPESALPTDVVVTKTQENTTNALDGGVSSIPRDSEITAAPSEDSSVDGGGSMFEGSTTDDVALLDEVKPAPDEQPEPSDLIFDVTLDGVALVQEATTTDQEAQPSVQSKGIPSGEPRGEPAVASVEIIELSSKIDVIPVSRAVYGTAKNVWSFGTHVPILNLWMGLTHHVAEQVVGIVGQELDSVDHGIETKLDEFDYHISRVLGR